MWISSWKASVVKFPMEWWLDCLDSGHCRGDDQLLMTECVPACMYVIRRGDPHRPVSMRRDRDWEVCDRSIEDRIKKFNFISLWDHKRRPSRPSSLPSQSQTLLTRTVVSLKKHQEPKNPPIHHPSSRMTSCSWSRLSFYLFILGLTKDMATASDVIGYVFEYDDDPYPF